MHQQNTDSLYLAGDWAPGYASVFSEKCYPLLLVNIEGSIFNSNDIIPLGPPKAGPKLFSNSLPLFVDKGIACLANNHLFDYGLPGYQSTKTLLEQSDWFSIGAGPSYQDAIKPLRFSLNNLKISVLARCETQFGIAQLDKGGVAPFDSSVYEAIRTLKNESDIVILTLHAAAELFPWPSPQRQRICRALIDAGANVVHCHHSHVPQGWEKYNKGIIFYGLGNFCVPPTNWEWHPHGLWSLVPEITIKNMNLEFNIETIVLEGNQKSIYMRRSSSSEYIIHQSYLADCNLPLSNPSLLEGLWQEFSVYYYTHYFKHWLGFDLRARDFLLYKLKIFKSSLSAKRLLFTQHQNQSDHVQCKQLLHYHLFACQSHSDAISTALGVLSGEILDLRSDYSNQLFNKQALLSKKRLSSHE